MKSNVIETIKTKNLTLEQAEEIYNKHVETAKQLAAERAMFD